MLAANANEPGFDLVVLWGVRRALATQAAAEAARQAEEARRAAEEERAKVRSAARTPLARVAMRAPTSLAGVVGATGGLRLDDVDCVAGDVVLLTAQSDGRENGLWTVGGGDASRPAETVFAGLLVRVADGTSAGGLVCCTAVEPSTGAVVFQAVRALASGGDAATVGGYGLEALRNKPLVGAGGAMDLVLNGDPTAASGDLRLRGLQPGPGVDLWLGGGSAGTSVVVATTAAGRAVTCVWRPADVVRTGGRARCGAAVSLGPDVWTPDEDDAAGTTALACPVMRYPATLDGASWGEWVGVVHGTPPPGDGAAYALTVDVAYRLAAPLPAPFVWDAVVRRAGGPATGDVVSDHATWTVGEAGTTGGEAPLVWPGGGGPPRWAGGGGCATVCALRLAAGVAWPTDLLVLGLRLTLTPA